MVVWLPEKPYVEQGYAACDLLRVGHSEQDVARDLGEKYSSKYGKVPESVLERHQRQIAGDSLVNGVSAVFHQ